MNAYLLGARHARPVTRTEVVAAREQLEHLRGEAFDAFRALLAHWKVCEARQQSAARAALRMESEELARLESEYKAAA